MIREARIEDIPLIADAITDEGRRELAEVYGMTPLETMESNFALPGKKWTMFSGDDALAMFGATPLTVLGNVGEFWIVSTVFVCRHRIAFSRLCRRFLPTLLAEHTELRGCLEHGRADVVKWAKWCGVKITPATERMSLMTLRAN